MAEVFKALSLVMNGQIHLVPTLIEDTLLMERISKSYIDTLKVNQPDHVLDIESVQSLWIKDKRLRDKQRDQSILANTEEEISRSIFVPNQFLKEMKDGVGEELEERRKGGEAAKRVSTGDVLVAWWIKVSDGSISSFSDVDSRLT